MAYLTPSPYLTPNPSDSNLTSYMTFGPGATSSGVVTYSAGGHAYMQSQSAGQILLQSAGHHGESHTQPLHMFSFNDNLDGLEHRTTGVLGHLQII